MIKSKVPQNFRPKALLFDMDGTLTVARQKLTGEVYKELQRLKGKYRLYLITGSDMKKVEEQISDDVMMELFTRVYACNGTIVYHTELDPDLDTPPIPVMIHKVGLLDHYSQPDINYITSTLLKYAAKNHTKYKTGTFVEWRESQINFSLIGRNCTAVQREDYVVWDKKSGDRDKAIEFLKEEFKGYGLAFKKGGQISIDITREGWDKTYAFENMNEDPNECLFFGDNVTPVGNDWEIAMSSGGYHCVDSHEELIEVLKNY